MFLLFPLMIAGRPRLPYPCLQLVKVVPQASLKPLDLGFMQLSAKGLPKAALAYLGRFEADKLKQAVGPGRWRGVLGAKQMLMWEACGVTLSVCHANAPACC